MAVVAAARQAATVTLSVKLGCGLSWLVARA
jgi:hypothetical protein